jgi:hypothetical protein
VTVPKAAIAPGPSLFLFKNGKAVRTAITLGAERNGRVEVLSGLSGGEQVIVGKLDGIADNMSVTARK